MLSPAIYANDSGLGISKVLAKEVALFGIRTLTVTLGTFNTNFANATIVGKNPLPDDYKDSVAEQMIQISM